MLEEIQELLDREPFVPFKIVMASGQAYEVVAPHLVALQKSQLIVARPKSDRYDILRHNQISSTEVLEPSN